MTSEEGAIDEFEQSALLEHHSAAQREANAAATSFRGEKWYEKGRTVFGRDGGTIVSDKQFEG